MDLLFWSFTLVAVGLGVYLGVRLFDARKRRMNVRKQWENKKSIVHREMSGSEKDLYQS